MNLVNFLEFFCKLIFCNQIMKEIIYFLVTRYFGHFKMGEGGNLTEIYFYLDTYVYQKYIVYDLDSILCDTLQVLLYFGTLIYNYLYLFIKVDHFILVISICTRLLQIHQMSFINLLLRGFLFLYSIMLKSSIVYV